MKLREVCDLNNNSKYDYYERKQDYKMSQSNKGKEFIYMLTELTGYNFDSKVNGEYVFLPIFADKNTTKNDPRLCLCSNTIYSKCHIKNLLTGDIYLVGSCCFKKFTAGTELNKQLTLEFRRTLNGTCIVCNIDPINNRFTKKKIPLNVCSTKCKEYLKLKEENRQCVDCNEYNIKMNKPAWNIRCYKCYLIKKQNK